MVSICGARETPPATIQGMLPREILAITHQMVQAEDMYLGIKLANNSRDLEDHPECFEVYSSI